MSDVKRPSPMSRVHPQSKAYILDLEGRNAELEAENRELREALEFYATLAVLKPTKGGKG